MKNGHLPDHCQLKLWIGLAAVIIAALARQSAIDVGGMSSFNANILFLGILVAFILLYLAFSSFLSEKVGLAIDISLRKLFKWMGFKEGKPTEPECGSEWLRLSPCCMSRSRNGLS